MIGCRCGAEWPGTRISHCSACHETFSGVSAFDQHRRRVKSETSKYVGRCLDPLDAGLSPHRLPGDAAMGTLIVWRLPLSTYMEDLKLQRLMRGHDINSGGTCRKPGCTWFSDHEDERFHTDEEGNRL